MLVVGDSGMGKSRSIMCVLEQYPQLIIHRKYNGVDLLITQIVWLKIDCPFDGSVKGLCINFFRALDSSLGLSGNERYEHIHGRTTETVNKMFSSMAMLARRFCIGVLVIDEIQYCLVAGTNINKFLQYLVTLENNIGIPTIYIGTAKTEKIIKREFTVARRLSSAGVITMKRLQNDEEYDYFLNEIWEYQWLGKISKLTSEIRDAMYDMTQGILSVNIALFMAIQESLIESGMDEITPKIIGEVAENEFKSIMPMILALRLGDLAAISMYDDLIVDFDLARSNHLFDERLLTDIYKIDDYG